MQAPRLVPGGPALRGGCALASSPHLGNLRFLALSDNRITDQGAIALARSKNLPALETLSLHDNPVGNPGRKALERRGFEGAV